MSDKESKYTELLAQAQSLLGITRDPIANAANLSALIFNQLEAINWAGFYFLRGDSLIVGPFQGQPACVEIPLGKGVCGTAASSGEIQRVADVHAFEGHIACDVASRSELVIPLFADGCLLGVLDIDSPKPNRFNATDQQGLVELAEVYLLACDFKAEAPGDTDASFFCRER